MLFNNHSSGIHRAILQRTSLLLTTLFLLNLSSLSASLAMNTSVPTSEQCMDSQRVLVIGANGQTGFRLVSILHKSKSYQPVAMIRETSQASRFDNLGVPWFVGDLDAGAPTVRDLEGAHTVIFAAGAGRSRPPLKKVTIDYLSAVRCMVAAQETQSVKRFSLLSGINTDPFGTKRSVDAMDLSGPLSAWHRLKAHSETYLKEMHLHGRPLDWTILCPGRLVDDPPTTQGLVKVSLIHGEDDLKESLTIEERKAAVRSLPGSHDGKSERLCVSRDNTAKTLMGLLSAPSTVGKSITVIDGLSPVDKALDSID